MNEKELSAWSFVWKLLNVFRKYKSVQLQKSCDELTAQFS